MIDSRKTLVTHHAPDLDAAGAVWLFKRFDSQHFADAKIEFVNPGERLNESNDPDLVHVDTGLGEFDHHQPDRGQQLISASSLVYDHVCEVHPDLKDDKALKTIVDFITEVDHFGEVNWPDPASSRYSFMIHELIRGIEFTNPHDDDSQLHFALTCLDAAYANLTQHVKAEELISEKGKSFDLKGGKAIAIETRNDDVIKLSQKMGYDLVVRKDTEQGHVRIKARPDSDIDFTELDQRIRQVDTEGTWYFHPGGKMLLNGSDKHRNQKPSPLSLERVVEIIKEVYG